MLRNKLYYGIKPLVPVSLRLEIRRWFARRKRLRVGEIWPILPGSEKAPPGWAGWPEGKQFAVVLTHDVEDQLGLDRCRALAELEKKCGFRSSFNLIPEGQYRVEAALREELTRDGFEVGVHDLHHDGKLFSSEDGFRRRASRINDYLKSWGATGFRAGFMLHNLDWLHELDIEYDASTFDVDPFEPQPDHCGSIFPFWVERNGKNGPVNGAPRSGYVELPYTLTQDSTLFLLLGERHPDIWFRKVDWVARNGGMVLLDTHPDYMTIAGRPGAMEYPIGHYQRLLEYIQTRYQGLYWHALPREVARFVRRRCVENRAVASNGSICVVRPQPKRKPKIWIDLDNTPHVPFFEPILEELRARGYPLLLTARDAFQVCELADKKGMQYLKIGRHYGKNPLLKAAGLAYRAQQLAWVALREKPALAVSHGARSQLLLANLMRIPTVLIEDYEYARFPAVMRPTWVIAPGVIPDETLAKDSSHILKYPGIKEEVYAWRLKPDFAALKDLRISETDLVVTVRPPATEAHYHNPESEKLFAAVMDRACSLPSVKIVLLPRNKKQGELIRVESPHWFKGEKTIIPPAALDGMNLVWHSDLVVSGGGTMNREAAALGVPVYSIFRGTIGAVDRHLSAEGRLLLIESVADVEQKIRFVQRPRRALSEVTSKRTLENIVNSIEEIAERSA